MTAWPLAGVEPAALPRRIARQAIVDADGRTVAGELLFRGRHADRSDLPSTWDAVRDEELTAATRRAMADQATSHVIVSTFGDFGIALLGAGKPLYLNVTRSFLLGDYPLPFGPQDIVLEILEDVEVDDDLLDGVRRLKEDGFSFALDDYIGEPSRTLLLPLVDVVKVDVLAPELDVEGIAARLRSDAPHARLLAERVETREAFERCHAIGFDLYQGYYFAYPDVLEATQLSPTQVTCVRLLQALSRPDTAMDELERVVLTDPGLSLQVLRVANSAASGTRTAVSSLRQALVLLGPRTLQSWVVLAVLGGGTSAEPQADLTTILTRAEACSAVAASLGVDTDAGRTLGLLSGVAQVLRTAAGPMASDASLAPEIVHALTDGAGDLGRVLRAVRAHELDLPDAAELAGLDSLTLSNLYLQAWADAVRTAGSVSRAT